MTISLLH